MIVKMRCHNGLLALVVAAVLTMAGHAAAEDGKPNIILIMADDLGIECVGTHGSLDYKTPVLDELASRGIKFNHCYSTPICTPSRVKIMTGRYGFRNYEQFGLLPPTEITFGNQMQVAGYNTHDGRWKLYNDGDFYDILNDRKEEKPLQDGELSGAAATAKAS